MSELSFKCCPDNYALLANVFVVFFSLCSTFTTPILAYRKNLGLGEFAGSCGRSWEGQRKPRLQDWWNIHTPATLKRRSRAAATCAQPGSPRAGVMPLWLWICSQKIQQSTYVGLCRIYLILQEHFRLILLFFCTIGFTAIADRPAGRHRAAVGLLAQISSGWTPYCCLREAAFKCSPSRKQNILKIPITIKIHSTEHKPLGTGLNNLMSLYSTLRHFFNILPLNKKLLFSVRNPETEKGFVISSQFFCLGFCFRQQTVPARQSLAQRHHRPQPASGTPPAGGFPPAAITPVPPHALPRQAQ